MKRLIVLVIAFLMIMAQVCVAAPVEEADTAQDTESVTAEFTDEEETAEKPFFDSMLTSLRRIAEMVGSTLLPYLSGPDLEHMTIGNPNPLNGKFFSDMWGNVTSDQDIRDLLFGYDLIRFDSETGGFEIDPAVVTGIVATEDPATGDRTYTMTLYDDLYYSDGTQVTAWDYAFSFLLTTSPLIRELGGTPDIKEQIVGYQDYVDGTTAYLAGVRVIADDTIAITVSGDYLPFFYELAMVRCKPYPISVIAPGVEVRDDGDGVYLANSDDTVEEPIFTADLLRETILDEETGYLSHPSVVSGPYVLTSWDGVEANFEINEYFKGKYAVTYQTDDEGEVLLDDEDKPVEIEYLATPTVKELTVTNAYYDTMLDELADGKFDLLNKITNGDVINQGLRMVQEHTDEDGNSEFAVTTYPRVGLSYIDIACEKEALSEEAVRQAIAYCLDRDALLDDYIGANLATRVDGYFGIGQWMYLLMNDPNRMSAPGEGASDEDVAKYEESMAGFEELAKIDEQTHESGWEEELEAYEVDPEKAAQILEAAGWTMNEETGIREKTVQDENGEHTLTLEFTMLYPEGSGLVEDFEEYFVANLKEAGIALTLQAAPLGDLLAQAYDPEQRDADMFFLASNLEIVFDPSLFFTTVTDPQTGEETHIWTMTGLPEETLYEEALAMRETEPGDVLSYCRHWLNFQKEFNRVLPMIPIYSNVYVDIYSGHLHNYVITESATWSEAIITAELQQQLVNSKEEEEETEEDVELEEGEVLFED